MHLQVESGNVFLCHVDLFDLSGGYAEDFRGHGSEDFEFFIRLCLLFGYVPEPKNIEADIYAPKDSSFWGGKNYEGFRRMMELLTYSCESLGFKAFHLWHPRLPESSWVKNNDWKRGTFRRVLSRYLHSREKLLSEDHLPRDMRALCIFRDHSHIGYHLPLRLMGYRLIPLSECSDADISREIENIESGVYHRVFVFNPYMKSHAIFRSLIEIARTKNIKVTIIERGALPNSIYYADEMSYADPDFCESSIEDLKRVVGEISVAHGARDLIISGSCTLESNGSYDNTMLRRGILKFTNAEKCFIPLQLSDDVAVTRFNDGHIPYADYMQNVLSVVNDHPDVLFIIKAHPLSKEKLNLNAENVVICDSEDNVHALIDLSDFVVVYNSGVGLLAAIHGKPVYCLGNSFYSFKNRVAKRIDSIGEAINDYRSAEGGWSVGPNHEDVLVVLEWLIAKKYSFFVADDVISEFDRRRAHGYKNISVDILNFYGVRKNLSYCRRQHSFSWDSYVVGRLSINNIVKNDLDVNLPKLEPASGQIQIGSPSLRLAAVITAKRLVYLLRKLVVSPGKFFRDGFRRIGFTWNSIGTKAG